MPIAIGCAFDALSALLSVKASQHCQYTIGTLYLTHPVPSIHSKFFRLFVRVHSPIILFNQNIKNNMQPLTIFFCKDLTRFFGVNMNTSYVSVCVTDSCGLMRPFCYCLKVFISLYCVDSRGTQSARLDYKLKEDVKYSFSTFDCLRATLTCSLPDNKWTNRSQVTRIQGRLLTTPSNEFYIQGPHLLYKTASDKRRLKTC